MSFSVLCADGSTFLRESVVKWTSESEEGLRFNIRA
jgi:hypothetical protein